MLPSFSSLQQVDYDREMSEADGHKLEGADLLSPLTFLPEISLALCTCRNGCQNSAKSTISPCGAKLSIEAPLKEHNTGKVGQHRKALVLSRLDRTKANGDHPQIAHFSSAITRASSTANQPSTPGAHSAAEIVHD
jgi:hypothetical protein